MTPDGGGVVVTVRALAAEVAVRVVGDDARVHGVAATLERAWSRCSPRSAVADPSAGEDVRVDLHAMDDDSALAWTTTAVTACAIDVAAPSHLLLHAAACADPPTGTAIALVGPSGRGKTTASLALGRRFAYLTDETVALTAAGEVVPYPKPLSLRVDGTTRKAQRSPDDLGLREADGRRWPLAAIVLLDRRTDAADLDGPDVVEVDAVSAVLALAPEVSALHRLEGGLLRLLDLVGRVGPVLRVSYAEAGTLVPVIERVLAERSERTARTHESRSSLPLVASRPPDGSEPPSGAVRRADALDAAEVDGSLVVLRAGSVVAAGGVAPHVWRLTGRWTAIDELRDALVADLGRPADAETAVRSAVDALVTSGLLERAP